MAFSSAATGAAAAPVLDFNVPPQKTERALVAVTVQANGSLGGDLRACDGQSPGFRGRATLKAALTAILANSACRFRIADDNAIVILRPPRSAAPLPAPAAPHDTPAAAESVIVTGARPDAGFASAGSALTVLDAGQLRLGGVGALADIAPLVAGMAATNLGPGRDKILLRGLSDGVFPGQAVATVALLLDNVPLNYTEKDPSLRLVDVAGVEIARAPQGLVSSAIGGVVRIQPRSPEMGVFGGSLSAGVQRVHHGGENAFYEAVANVPLVADTVAARVVLYDVHEPGYIHDNLAKGVTATNDASQSGGRLALRSLIGPHWSLTTGLVWQRLKVADSQYVFDNTADLSRTNRIAEPSSNNSNYGYFTLSGGEGRYHIKWTESYSDHAVADRYDATQSLGVFGLSTAIPAAFDRDQHVQTFVSDLSATATLWGGRWRAGVLAVREKDTQNAALGLITQPSAPLYQDTRRDERSDYSTYFGAIYPLLSNLDLDLGATAYSLDQKIDANAVNTSGAVVGKPYTTELKQSGFKPSAALIYTPTAWLTLSARVSTGARPPGVNTGVLLAKRPTGVSPYQANRTFIGDRVTEFELTQKFTLPNAPLTVSLAEYVVQWRQIQADEFSIYNTPITVNVGDGALTGFEAEVTYRAPGGIDLHALGGSEHTSLGGQVTKAYFSGSYGGLIGVPSYNASVSANKAFGYRSLSNTVAVQYTALGPSEATFDGLTASSLKGYETVDLVLDSQFKHWDLLLSVRNALDNRGDTLAFGNPFSVQRGRQFTPVRPRTVSAKLTYRF